MSKEKNCAASIGGQAVIEGVMMRGPEKWCLAVRNPQGDIVTEEHPTKKHRWTKWPIIRGVFSFFESFITGYKTLMRSADIALDDDEQQEQMSKLDKWVDEKLGDKGTTALMIFSTLVGVALALFLFMWLPTATVGFLDTFVPLGGWKTILEGVIKIGIFIAYLALVRCMDDMMRIFRYHGAEHKTVACYEAGDTLTAEKIHTYSRLHPRCGTSFVLIVLIISILIFSVLPWTDTLLRVGLKLLFLPLVMGIAYELIRLAGRYNNPFTRVISAPGLWLQRLTTAEPDDDMIEVAIAAMQPVLPENQTEQSGDKIGDTC